ncbi:hypothetical protein [Psychroflexus sp. ALD_RP9]|uniref:hypothetical protein n=1 Tax=Psychroflexus sp. ALD_RP9 TaxID=2777186 RepID=UPI001A8CB1FE|nr:hypothetical protein [Psychroflexus sp. ALD_RP9]QSS96302.1 hypothetical protein IMZ30_07490 [Psychroflexus sp. ALD_RP9]
MYWNKKFKAYTLSEIIVVLILTSIVVGLALSALGLIQQQMTALRYNNENNFQIKSLETKLSILFNQSQSIKIVDNQVYFYRLEDTLITKMSPNAFIINQDSIKLEVTNLKSYFRGEANKTGNIDALSLEIKLHKEISKTLFVSRSNDAKTKLEQWE